MNRSRIIPESSGPYARALTTRRQETGVMNAYFAYVTTCSARGARDHEPTTPMPRAATGGGRA